MNVMFPRNDMIQDQFFFLLLLSIGSNIAKKSIAGFLFDVKQCAAQGCSHCACICLVMVFVFVAVVVPVFTLSGAFCMLPMSGIRLTCLLLMT